MKMPLFLAVIALSLTMALSGCATHPPLLTASARAQGVDYDMVITEIKREPTKSRLQVSGAH